MRERQIDTDDVRLHVVEAGDPARPGLVLLHGFPDCHAVWQSQLEALSDEFHVISFDLRGVGQSTRSGRRHAYHLDYLTADLTAVIDATRGPGHPVHLVGHDWGSIIGWNFLRRPEGRARALSWTSISGPDLAMLGDWVARKLRSGRRDQVRDALHQLSHSWYVFAFQVPGLARTLFGVLGARLWRRVLRAGGVPADHPYLRAGADEARARTLGPVRLYQQNRPGPASAGLPLHVDTPTRVLICQQDIFVRPCVFEYLHEYVFELDRVEVEANHWVQCSHPDAVTEYIRAFARQQARGWEQA
jgi:pimeloyl-ACP methyl ester carboxylesterase